MRHLHIRALQVGVRLLVLARTKNLLVGIQALEPEREVAVTADDRFELAGYDLQGAAFGVFGVVAAVAGVFF